jgi:hypothetical protein
MIFRRNACEQLRVGTLSLAAFALSRLLPAAMVILLLPAIHAEQPKASPMHVTLPQSVGGWTLVNPARIIEPKGIFDYMDGAGELYLGYRFNHLEACEFSHPRESNLLVELYWMDSPGDAFGLLSGDWGGDPVDLAGDGVQPVPRALYGAGLLRIWSGDLYARVMAYQETDAAKQAVFALGKAIVTGRPPADLPPLVKRLPRSVGSQFSLRPDRTAYLRSHLVLNSVYFLSTENLLDLNRDCELAAGTYRPTSGANAVRQPRALLVRYPDEPAARKALAHFQHVYLAGKSFAHANDGSLLLEDGWMGFVLSGRALALVFEAPDEASTRLFLADCRRAQEELETAHE